MSFEAVDMRRPSEGPNPATATGIVNARCPISDIVACGCKHTVHEEVTLGSMHSPVLAEWSRRCPNPPEGNAAKVAGDLVKHPPCFAVALQVVECMGLMGLYADTEHT